MKLCTFFCALIAISCSGFAETIPENGSYWQCKTHDKNNVEWLAQSVYQKMAMNLAFASCKKESAMPESCSSSKLNCEGFFQGVSTSPMWRCTALDVNGDHWPSNIYNQRDDSALAAIAYCKDNSNVPETCYMNMVTCFNFNDGMY